MVTMPRSKGKANYKVNMLILVVEEMLPNGAQAWQEVAVLCQACSGEMVPCDHDDIKRHWVDKCCNKFKEPTGTPGDPKRDMILRCQRIQEWILQKLASCIMGADLEGMMVFPYLRIGRQLQGLMQMMRMWRMAIWWMALLLRVLVWWQMNRRWWRN
jgi:hypothetical protein